MQSLWTFSAFLRVRSLRTLLLPMTSARIPWMSQIIMGIEEEFDVTVDPDVAATVTTVGQALELIKNAVEGA